MKNMFDFSSWPAYATQQERELDQHIADFKDGLNDDCECGVCLELRELERRNYEQV